MAAGRQHPEDFGIGRLFYVISEAIIAADLADQRIVLWNAAATELFGYGADEAIGMRLDALVPEALLEQHRSGMRRYHAGGTPVLIGAAPVVVPTVTKSGEALHVALSLTDVSAGHDRKVVLAVLRDVTAQLKAEAELAAANESMRQFVATASHDLRTPLATVLGFSQLLAEDVSSLSDAQKHESANAVLRAAQQASRLVDDLLTLSQIQADAVAPRPQPVSLAAAAREAASAANVDAEVVIADDAEVLVDPDHLRRILENYLTNADRYGSAPILVQASSTEAGVEVRVCDAGPGVPVEFVERLFTSFARADTSRSDSTGLGLSIVKGLAEANGGSVSYERHPDGGACFGTVLPFPAR